MGPDSIVLAPQFLVIRLFILHNLIFFLLISNLGLHCHVTLEITFPLRENIHREYVVFVKMDEISIYTKLNNEKFKSNDMIMTTARMS